jgi:hypothetical protein
MMNDELNALIISTMECLFSPCTRFRDILESQGHLERLRIHGCEQIPEVNLDVSTEELLSAERSFTYADLYAMSGNGDTVAWLTPHAAIVRRDGTAEHAWCQLDESCGFHFRADGKDIVVVALSPEHLLELSGVVLRLLSVSVVHEVDIDNNWSNTDGELINAPALAYLMEQRQSLKVLKLKVLEMDENHCRVLGDYSRPGLEIVLHRCKITSAGAGALVEVLGRNQGPSKLDLCEIDNFVLANGLRGNSRLKSFRPCLSNNVEVRSREILAIAGALRENKGLVSLTCGLRMSDETWDAVCDSLKAHPTLEVLDLRSREAVSAPSEVLESRIRALVDMMKGNMSIQTIPLDYQYCRTNRRQKLVVESVFPYLETNQLRPRVLAIQKTLPQAYRSKVLGGALLAVRSDPNRFWMLLSGNAEVAIPSTTVTTTAAASLPMPANVAAAGNVAPVVATASTTAASSFVAPTAGQKRKTCPIIPNMD